jgi:hypothetical protein
MPIPEDDRYDDDDHPPPTERGGGKIVLIVLGALALLVCLGGALAVVGFGVRMRKIEEARRIEEESRADPVVVRPAELISAYRTNRGAADDRFKNKWLRIEGDIKEIGRAPASVRRRDITFGGDDPAETIRIVCKFETDWPPGGEKLRDGDAVTVVGWCRGKDGSFSPIELVECEFVNWHAPPDRPDDKRRHKKK